MEKHFNDSVDVTCLDASHNSSRVEQGNIVGCRDGHTSHGNVPKSGKGKGKGKRKGDAEFGKTKPAAEANPLPAKKAWLLKDAIWCPKKLFVWITGRGRTWRRTSRLTSITNPIESLRYNTFRIWF